MSRRAPWGSGVGSVQGLGQYGPSMAPVSTAVGPLRPGAPLPSPGPSLLVDHLISSIINLTISPAEKAALTEEQAAGAERLVSDIRKRIDARLAAGTYPAVTREELVAIWSAGRAVVRQSPRYPMFFPTGQRP